MSRKFLEFIITSTLAIVSGILLGSVGGWKLILGVWIFGWMMNLENELK